MEPKKENKKNLFYKPNDIRIVFLTLDILRVIADFCGPFEFYRKMSSTSKEFYKRFGSYGDYGKFTRDLYQHVADKILPYQIINIKEERFTILRVIYENKGIIVSNTQLKDSEQILLYFGGKHFDGNQSEFFRKFVDDKTEIICGSCGKYIRGGFSKDRCNTKNDRHRDVYRKNKIIYATKTEKFKDFLSSMKIGDKYQQEPGGHKMLKRKREYMEYIYDNQNTLDIIDKFIGFPQMGRIPDTVAVISLDISSSVFDRGEIFDDGDIFETPVQSFGLHQLFYYSRRFLSAVKFIRKLKADIPFSGWRDALVQLSDFRKYYESDSMNLDKIP